jgi:flagellin
MASILNNITALSAQRNLNNSNLGMDRTVTRLSTGLRINQAKDDAAGLSIANKLRMDVRVLNQAVRNANDGISIIQTADNALNEVSSLLTRAAQLAEEAASDTSGGDSSSSKTALDDEYQAILTEITRLGSTLEFNNTQLFSGSAQFDIKVGAGASTVITISSSTGLGDLSASNLTLTGDLQTKANATTEQARISAAMSTISQWRGDLGAIQARLETTINTLSVSAENIQAAESRIRDADIATEVVNLTKYQILQQSGTAALAQANAASQNVLALLR